MNIRKPAVAGHFYPGDRNRLLKTIERLIDTGIEKQDAKSVIAPHAAYMYSGRVAGMVFSRIEIPEKVILLGPDHRSYGSNAFIMTEGVWEMPLGDVNIDNELAEDIVKGSDILCPNAFAHNMEHSLEVQIPFLQYFQPHFSIVPIILSGDSLSLSESVANGIVSGIKEQNEKILIIASTDLTHYQTQSIANEQDNRIIEKIIALDPKGLLELVTEDGLSMCGYLPVTTAILATKLLGAKSVKLVKYMTSGDVSGELSHVVGYAGMIIQ